ncbi:MAG: Gfo/Idh/MocA family protein [Planctomycetota bacterium]
MRHFFFGLLPVSVLLLLSSASQGTAADPELPLRAGVIGLDAHARSWAQILNAPEAEGELADMKVVAGYAAGSPDIPQSQKLLEKGLEAFKTLDIPLVDSIPELLETVDVVLVLSIDGRGHLAQAREVIEAGKPLFIDKPVAASLADATEIYRLAREHDVPCFSSSSLRFAPGTQAVLDDPKIGDILGCDAHSPCAIEPHHPDFFWYGIHGVETLFTIMGTGCKTVTRVHAEHTDVAVGVWEDGRIGTFRGHRAGPHAYGAAVFGQSGVVQAGEFEGYEPLLVEIVKFFKTGVPPVSAEQTLEILAFMEAADTSKEQGGRPVELPPTGRVMQVKASESR